MNQITASKQTQLMTVENGFYHFPKEATVKQILNALPKATEEEIIEIMQPMFATMPSRDQGEIGFMNAMMGYLMALDEAPIFALQASVRAFIRGEVAEQHKTFRPSPAMFSSEVRRQIFIKVRREKLFDAEKDAA